jgi:hypothetical protein
MDEPEGAPRGLQRWAITLAGSLSTILGTLTLISEEV